MLRQRSQNDEGIKPDMRVEKGDGCSLHPYLLPSSICCTCEMNSLHRLERVAQITPAVPAQKNDRAPTDEGHEDRHNSGQKFHAINTRAHQNEIGTNADKNDAKNTMTVYALPKYEKVLRSECHNLPRLRGQTKKEGCCCHFSNLQAGNTFVKLIKLIYD